MKPNDIDAIINSKLRENHQLYREEMNASKPFIWGEIRSNLSPKRSLHWYYLAAAMFLLLFLSAFAFHQLNQTHEREIDALSLQIHQIQQNYDLQTTKVANKNKQIAGLEDELTQINNQLSDHPEEQQTVRTIYLREVDTVFLTREQVKVKDSNSFDSGKTYPAQALLKPVLENEPSEPEIDLLIYPDYTNDGGKPPVATPIKVRFGSFTAKKD